MTLNELTRAIQGWGLKTRVTINGKPQAQGLKLISEFGELCGHIIEGEDIRDDIGDMFVVLVMITELERDTLQSFTTICDEGWIAMQNNDCEFFRQDPIVQTVAMGECLGRLSDNLTKRKMAELGDDIICVLQMLGCMAAKHGYSLRECVRVAWEEIKDRDGDMNEEGVFIKKVA